MNKKVGILYSDLANIDYFISGDYDAALSNYMNSIENERKILNYKTPLEALLEEFNDKSVINKIYKLQEKVNCL